MLLSTLNFIFLNLILFIYLYLYSFFNPLFILYLFILIFFFQSSLFFIFLFFSFSLLFLFYDYKSYAFLTKVFPCENLHCLIRQRIFFYFDTKQRCIGENFSIQKHTRLSSLAEKPVSFFLIILHF